MSTQLTRAERNRLRTPGYFIKVDNAVPFYLIKVSFPNQFYLDYVLRAWNDNGMVSIPVPPKGYQALVTVVPESAQSNGPLSFTSEVFQNHYNTSLENGYYVLTVNSPEEVAKIVNNLVHSGAELVELRELDNPLQEFFEE
jgi:hypothetical protein